MENKFESICNELVVLQKAKNTDYGDSFSKSVKEFGLTAALIPITNKVNRLKQLIQSDSAQVKDESIDDTLKDLACYAIMTLAERKGKLAKGILDITPESGRLLSEYIRGLRLEIDNRTVRSVLPEDKDEYIKQFRRKRKEATNIEIDRLKVRSIISNNGWRDLEGCAPKEEDVIGDILSNIRHNLFIAELSKDVDGLLKKYNIKF